MNNPAAQALSGVKAFKMPSFGKFGGLMRREYLDHKTAFFWVPLVIAGFMIFGFVSSAIIGNTMMGELGISEHIKNGEIVIDGERGSVEDAKYMIERMADLKIDAFKRAMGFAMLALLSPFMLAIPLIILFALLGSLYDDRRDRSYLFWKSMPIGDTTEVLSKLFAITVMGPAVVIGFAAVVQIVWMLITLAQGASYGFGGATFSFLWNHIPTVSLWLGMVGMVALSVIWALPIIGWLMFVSSVAKKAALMVAVVPIAAIAAMEGVFFKSTIFIKWIVDRLVGWAANLDGIDFDRIEVSDKLTSPFLGGVFERFGEAFATGEFWFSTAVGAAFIAGAIYMRRYNV